MTNAWKHSGVHKGTIEISKMPGKISIKIIDKGKGFDSLIQKNVNSLGMKSLTMRAKELNADFSVRSEPGNGCAINLLLNKPVQ
jgi:signal transduction histidine kinase